MCKSYHIDHINQKVFLKASFIRAAGRMGSREYNELLALRRELPDYEFKPEETNRKKTTSKNKNLTYLKQIICPNLLDGDCWNVCIENSILTFYFYWEDDDNEYMDCITIKLDNNMAIKGIEPIQAERMSYCDSRYADYAPCRATANHYMNLDHYMVKACVPIIDWDNLTDEQKLGNGFGFLCFV